VFALEEYFNTCMTITKILCMLLVLVFGFLFFLFLDKVVVVRSKIVYNLSVRSSLNYF
jgi:hypothetical protein